MSLLDANPNRCDNTTQIYGELGLDGHCRGKETQTAGNPNLAVGEQSHKRSPKVHRITRVWYFFFISHMYPDL